jgi:hypothetical protein
MHRPRHRHIGLPALLGLVMLLPLGLSAQNEEDALRIGTLMPGGTARSAGLANAFGALGADGSAISINPAGFGVYRTSELSFTPSLEVNDAQASYYGTSASDTQTRFNFTNLLLAINNPSKSGGDWRSSTYGVAFDRQATHHWRHQAVGTGVPSSILHHFWNEASAFPNTNYATDYPFTSSLAWETFGLNADSVTALYPMIPFGAVTDQRHTMETRGVSNNTAFFFAGNYLDRLYVGASLGIVGHRFRRIMSHTETTPDQELDLAELTYREELATTGNGLDLKLGVIGRITERFRMGLSFHSPQWMQLTDGYVMEMSTRFRTPDLDGNFSYGASSPDGVFNYRLNTPWRVVGSAAYVAGSNGLFSVDYEYSDPRRMRFRSASRLVDEYDFQFENEAIATVFRPVHTVRAGTEWRTGPWYYRLGWGFSTDPYVTSDPRHGRPLRNYAGGIGYRTDHIGIDLGLNVIQRGIRYFQYGQDVVDATVADLGTFRTLLTVSFRP